jgi:hypothetical protein
MTKWSMIHEKEVDQFRAGWDRPRPHAWGAFADEAMRFAQPTLRDDIGPEVWWEESSGTLALPSNVRADDRLRRRSRADR